MLELVRGRLDSLAAWQRGSVAAWQRRNSPRDSARDWQPPGVFELDRGLGVVNHNRASPGAVLRQLAGSGARTRGVRTQQTATAPLAVCGRCRRRTQETSTCVKAGLSIGGGAGGRGRPPPPGGTSRPVGRAGGGPGPPLGVGGAGGRGVRVPRAPPR